MQQSTTKGSPFLLASHTPGIASFRELLGSFENGTSAGIRGQPCFNVYFSGHVSLRGRVPHHGHQYAAKNEISSKESLSKHHERRIAQQRERKVSGAMTADAAE
jgi:hypothetical protein